MNHIPRPRINKSTSSEIRIRSFCNEPYDGLGFSDYPLRKGWRHSPSGPLTIGDRTYEAQAAFLQTWLFFGTLEEVLGCNVPQDHFIKDGYIDTTQLPFYIRGWYERVRQMSEEDRRESWLKALRCLTEVRSHCAILLDEKSASCPLPSDVCLSIRILGESLSNSMRSIWTNLSNDPIESRKRNWTPGPCPDPLPHDLRGRWGYSEILVSEMLDLNWCPSDVEFLKSYPVGAVNTGLYYARSFLRRRPERHDKCNRWICALRQVPDKQKYTRRHCLFPPVQCGGRCDSKTPSQEAVCSILDNGGIPLLKVSPSNHTNTNDISFDIVKYEEGMEYTAISHVWSDGFGSPESNSILCCQAAFILHCIAAIENRRSEETRNSGEVLFWIDTLLVPTDQTRRPSKILSLDRMGPVYQNATGVLILDGDLIQKEPADDLEAVMEVICSNWMRRLWTLQEGVLGGGRLHIIFKNGTWDLSRIVRQLRQEHVAVPWTAHPMLAFATRFGMLQVARLQGPGRTSWLFREMNWRSTTKSSDEAIIFANLTGKGSAVLYTVAREYRMKMALSNAKSLTSRIIFAPGLRFQEQGCRWALKSFLIRSSFSLVGDEIQPSLHGISVTYPGYILEMPTPTRFADLKEFYFFDATERKWLRAQKPLVQLYEVAAQEPDLDESEEPPIQRVLYLIIHRFPWMSKHAYGAVLAPDQVDGWTTGSRILTGTHQGVFDVFVAEIDTLPEKLNKDILFHTRDVLDRQIWVVR